MESESVVVLSGPETGFRNLSTKPNGGVMRPDTLVIDRKAIPAIPRPVYAMVAERIPVGLSVSIMAGQGGNIQYNEFESLGTSSFPAQLRFWLESRRHPEAEPELWRGVCDETANRIEDWLLDKRGSISEQAG
jgi:hypothetical protein